MAKFIINYHTGEELMDTFEGTLEEAREYADKHACYTQKAITIESETGHGVSQRSWWGSLSGIEDCTNPLQFGDFGFYGDWY